MNFDVAPLRAWKETGTETSPTARSRVMTEPVGQNLLGWMLAGVVMAACATDPTDQLVREAEQTLVASGGVFSDIRGLVVEEYLGPRVDEEGVSWHVLRVLSTPRRAWERPEPRERQVRVKSAIGYDLDDPSLGRLRDDSGTGPLATLDAVGRLTIEVNGWFSQGYTAIRTQGDQGDSWSFTTRRGAHESLVSEIEELIRDSCEDLIARQQGAERADIDPVMERRRSGFMTPARCDVIDRECVFRFHTPKGTESCGGRSPIAVRRMGRAG